MKTNGTNEKKLIDLIDYDTGRILKRGISIREASSFCANNPGHYIFQNCISE